MFSIIWIYSYVFFIYMCFICMLVYGLNKYPKKRFDELDELFLSV